MDELENIMLSEVSQVQKAKGHTFSLMWNIDRPNINTSNILYIKHVPQSGTGKGNRGGR
jgi:hypothetical protein